MEITCPKCSRKIDNEDKAQIGSVVKKGKCPHCSEKVDINTDWTSLAKPIFPFLAIMLAGFFTVMVLQRGFTVFVVCNAVLCLFMIMQKFKIRERELLSKGLKTKVS